MRGERQLSFDRAQALTAAGSRYGPAAPLLDFAQALSARLSAMRYAAVAMPAFARLRLDAAAAAGIEREEYKGMRRRLAEGTNREAPVAVPAR